MGVFICPTSLCRFVVRGSVSSCYGFRPCGITVLRSSSLYLPVWCQDSLLCPPPEGPVPLTPSFTTLSPFSLMVNRNTLWIYNETAFSDDITKGIKTFWADICLIISQNCSQCNLRLYMCLWAAKVVPEEITPLVPAVVGEKVADDQTCYILETLLKYMVIQVRTCYFRKSEPSRGLLNHFQGCICLFSLDLHQVA